MANKRTVILDDGKLALIKSGQLTTNDFYSGFEEVPTGEIYDIPVNRQSTNFTIITLDGTINLDGDLWLA